MKPKYFIIIILVLFLSFLFYSKVNKKEQDYHFEEPAHVEQSEESDFPLVVLTQKAIDRLDIQTITTSKNQLIIPYSTIKYDVNGNTWVYENPEPMVYTRKQVYISSIPGEEVILTEPLPEKTTIVTVGVPELSGVEHGIGQGSGGH